MKYALILLSAFMLSACEPKSVDVTNTFVLPDTLADCTITVITNTNGGLLNVVRCPSSSTSTTYQQGKSQQTFVVIDGQKYVKAEK